MASFLIGLFAVWLAERKPTMNQTYGFHRIEVFGAVLSVFMIWILTGVLCYEAVLRIITPQEVDGMIMFVTAAAGVVVNLAMMRILHQGHGHSHGGGGGGHGHSHGEGNINVRAAFIHAVGDLVQSVGVMIAAIIIWAEPRAHVADPICTFLFSILVLFTTFGIMRTAARTLLNSVPTSVNMPALASQLAAIPGVANIHDLHVWAFGTGRVAMTVHMVADDPPAALVAAQEVAATHDIGHSTVQVERCGSADVANCYRFNEHIGGCAFTLEDPALAKAPRAHSHGVGSLNGGGGAGYLAGDDGAAATHLLAGPPGARVIERPTLQARHVGPDGCGALLSPAKDAAPATPPDAFSPTTTASSHHHHHHHHHHHATNGTAASVGGHGHSHGAGDDDHGHSHGGHDDDHGHSHGGGDDDHGHSHGGGDDDHGHSHAHAHAHGHSSDEEEGGGHGHSHGGAPCTGAH